MKWLTHVGARRGTAGWLCRTPERTGYTGGGAISSVTHYGHKAILDEVVGPGLVAVNTCVDIVCVK